MDKYKLFCTTDNKWEEVIASSEPTKCPTNQAHSFDSDSISVINQNIQVNDGTPKELTLDDYKLLRYNEIDGKTLLLISQGFSYDNEQFSLSLAAQNNWNTLKHSELDFIWPVDISTIENGEYTLQQINLEEFWTAGRDVAKGHLDSGRALKLQVKNSNNESEVDAVEDNR